MMYNAELYNCRENVREGNEHKIVQSSGIGDLVPIKKYIIGLKVAVFDSL